MMQKRLKELKRGEFFTLKDYGEYPEDARVYVKGDYDRSLKKYSCTRFMDCNAETFRRGDLMVYVGFTF